MQGCNLLMFSDGQGSGSINQQMFIRKFLLNPLTKRLVILIGILEES